MDKQKQSEGSSFGTIVVVTSLIIFGYWIFSSPSSSWTGFFYPDTSDLSKYNVSQKLDSLDECRNWVDGQIDRYKPSGHRYDYECGKNCKQSEKYDGYICDETLN